MKIKGKTEDGSAHLSAEPSIFQHVCFICKGGYKFEKFILFLLCMLIFIVFCACGEDKSSSSDDAQADYAALQELSGNNASVEDETVRGEFFKSISLPKNYIKVDRGDNVYIYDSEGTSLTISRGDYDVGFFNYTESDSIKLLGANRAEIDGAQFSRDKISEKEAILIRYESKRQNREHFNAFCYVECDGYMIKIYAQAIDKDNLEELLQVIETIKF